MNYTEQYIKVLKKVNKSSGKFHIGRSNKNYSEADKQLLVELIGDGYANGKHQSINKEIQILEVSPTAKGRKYLEELEQQEQELKLIPNTKEKKSKLKQLIFNPWSITIIGGLVVGAVLIFVFQPWHKSIQEDRLKQKEVQQSQQPNK